ncbi:MAG TPA: iron-containing alcohol dehydrogenase [Roseiflexaceae bacterium]|nr:iron-containing alcohol dehydrogenase [Roseiflexaceae bacterium]
MRYEFATAGRIIFGPGAAADLAALVESAGRRALLVHGRGATTRGGPAAGVMQRLAARGLVAASYAAGSEPDVAAAEAAAALAREAGCDCVVGIGGGSVLDTAKAAAALAANAGGALAYLEVVGAGRALERPALPVVAVPTTAGTGSEATRNAVLGVPERRVKASMRHASMLPRLALVDPLLTHDMPPALTASSGMDAITQLIEAYVSRRASPLTDALCLRALPELDAALRRAYQRPEDAVAREAMSQAALFSGMALANAGLGAVHGIAAAVGGAFPAPHGAVCAALLPHVTAANIRALRRAGAATATARYREIAQTLLGRQGPAEDALLECLRDLAGALAIPGLARYGVTTADIPALAMAASQASSTRSNPVALSQAELEETIAAAL